MGDTTFGAIRLTSLKKKPQSKEETCVAELRVVHAVNTPGRVAAGISTLRSLDLAKNKSVSAMEISRTGYLKNETDRCQCS